MISWKDSFEKLDNELGVAKKKQDALEELQGNGRISQPTYENLNKTLTTEIEQIEARRKELAGKMTSKLNDLEKQISTLELFLANVEMSFAASEITEELHNQEVSALNLGLEATKNELNFIKDAIMQLVPEETQAELAAAAEAVEATPIDTDMETTPEVSETAPIETPLVTDETSIEQSETIVEVPETPEMPETPIETSTEETTEELTEEIQEETTPEEQIVSETPVETSTEEMLSEEQVTEEIVEAPTEETMPEELIVTETQKEEIVSEEPILFEETTEETLSDEQIVTEAPIEETTEEIVSEEIVSEAPSEEVIPEEEVVSETLTEDNQPFLDENSE